MYRMGHLGLVPIPNALPVHLKLILDTGLDLVRQLSSTYNCHIVVRYRDCYVIFTKVSYHIMLFALSVVLLE